MNNLVLIRHGEVEYPTNSLGQRLIYGPKVELSREGYRQADALAKTLRDENITPDNVYSSPYIRAFFTAVPIANEFDKGLYTDEDLIDVYAPGWEGRTMDELKEVGGDIYAAPPMSDDQETLPTLVERAHNVLQKDRKSVV